MIKDLSRKTIKQTRKQYILGVLKKSKPYSLWTNEVSRKAKVSPAVGYCLLLELEKEQQVKRMDMKRKGRTILTMWSIKEGGEIVGS